MTVQEFYKLTDGDYDAVKKRLMTDALIMRVLPKLVNEPSRVTLENTWKAGDRDGLFEPLHALKGVCANLGLTSLADKVSEALEPLRPGTSLTISDEELDQKIRSILEQFDTTVGKIGEIGS